ncbi:MAG: SDR family oxidoreductase [Dehalococcoidia bacterium]
MSDSLLGMEDKVVVVTGAAQGMGRAIALMFAKAGAHAVIADLQGEKAEEVAGEVRALGREAIAVRADVAVLDDVQRMMAATLERFGRLDVGVNNAGGLGGQSMQPVVDATLEFWDDVVALNLRSVFLGSQAFARAMIDGGTGGAIVNIASISGLRASVALAPYGAAKAGVMHLTQTLAVELAPHGIRVNCVAPASIRTTGTERYMTPQRRAIHGKAIPIGRTGVPEEVAGMVLMLASPLAAYVTGQTLMADGGLSCTSARPPAQEG